MYLRKHGKIELWGSIHPSDIGCTQEGRGVCSCSYHLTDEDRSFIDSYQNYTEADAAFRNVTGTDPFVVGKSQW